MDTLTIGSSRKVYRNLVLIRMLNDIHYASPVTGMLCTGTRLSDYGLSDIFALPDAPDTSYTAVQKTPFYKRTVKTGNPSALLQNLIGRL